MLKMQLQLANFEYDISSPISRFRSSTGMRHHCSSVNAAGAGISLVEDTHDVQWIHPMAVNLCHPKLTFILPSGSVCTTITVTIIIMIIIITLLYPTYSPGSCERETKRSVGVYSFLCQVMCCPRIEFPSFLALRWTRARKTMGRRFKSL